MLPSGLGGRSSSSSRTIDLKMLRLNGENESDVTCDERLLRIVLYASCLFTLYRLNTLAFSKTK
jgi:hypothetical protein